MRIEFSERALAHYEWLHKHKPRLAKKLDRLLQDIERQPFRGLGKPEPLKHDYSGCWSRRISEEHRLVYEVKEDLITILQCRFHYDKK